jgi:hypothetical protein
MDMTPVLQNSDVFLAVDEDRKGRIMLQFEDTPLGITPSQVCLTAFRSNVNDDAYFVAVSDTTVDGEGKRYESTFYVNSKQAALLAKVFTDIAAKL